LRRRHISGLEKERNQIMESILEPIVSSPKLNLYLKQLQDIVNDENIRRQRFYQEIREDRKAEFINGEAVIHSPVKIEHNKASVLLCSLLQTYVSLHRLGFVGHEKILTCFSRNDYEPDVCFFSRAKSDLFKKGQMKFPPPDFIAEVISPSTEHIDRTDKFADYAAHGVGEYWIIDPAGESIEKYVLRSGSYELSLKVRTGMIHSDGIAGFEIPVRAVFDEDENIAALRKILQ
jgi:Uma2 family endonuclease